MAGPFYGNISFGLYGNSADTTQYYPYENYILLRYPIYLGNSSSNIIDVLIQASDPTTQSEIEIYDHNGNLSNDGSIYLTNQPAGQYYVYVKRNNSTTLTGLTLVHEAGPLNQVDTPGTSYGQKSFYSQRWPVNDTGDITTVGVIADALPTIGISITSGIEYLITENNIFANGPELSQLAADFDIVTNPIEQTGPQSKYDLSRVVTTYVTDMSNLFSGLSNFNQDISKWDVSDVTNMSSMFYQAISFNQDISKWNVSSCTNFSSMFNEATNFNADISCWVISGSPSMDNMFNNAASFNRNLNYWNVTTIPSEPGNFKLGANDLWTSNPDFQPKWGAAATATGNVINGAGPPNDAKYSNGDYYIDTLTWVIYGPKTGGSWGTGSNPIVDPMSGDVLFSSGNPQNAWGSDGDYYIDTNTNEIIGPKSGGTWPTQRQDLGNYVSGNQPGDPVTHVGNGAPSSGLGMDGDYYVDTFNDEVYGPKTGGSWGTGSPTPNGGDIFTGVGPPDNGDGNPDGSWWVDTQDDLIYGPKTGGMYPGVGQDLGDFVTANAGGGGGSPTGKVTNRDPTVNDDNTQGCVIGSIWYNYMNGNSFIAIDVTTGAAVWAPLSSQNTGTPNKVEGRNPTVTDDSNAGCEVGSIWYNNIDDVSFIATDVTPGNALWEPLISTPAPSGGSSNKVEARGPTVTDDSNAGCEVGSIWYNYTTGNSFIAIDVTPGAAVWELISEPNTGTPNKVAGRDPTPNDDSTQGCKIGSIWYNTITDVSFIALGVTPGAAVWDPLTTEPLPPAPAGTPNKVSNRGPLVTDDSSAGCAVGSIWFNTTTEEAFIAVSVTPGAAVWEPLNDAASPRAGIVSGNGPPAPTDPIGNNGDFYIDNLTGDLYGPKLNGIWPSTPLRGPSVASASNNQGVLGFILDEFFVFITNNSLLVAIILVLIIIYFILLR